MRTKNNDWINTKTNEKLLGIDVSKDGKKWMHLASDGKPFFAKNEDEREAKRAELRKL